MSKRIAVFGASGFVGATLIEQLVAKDQDEVRMFIRGSGNAWRLSRHDDWKLQQVDILDRKQLKEALKGCTHVVNCTRGGALVMNKGLRNMMRAAKREGVRRFVHLSSVAVYGDPPHPESVKESAPAEPAKKTYGAVKLQQDQMVEAAHQAGLSSVVLCPPNISGVYSAYVQGIVEDMRKGTLGLLDGGSMPCVLVDVANLCHAIRLALDTDKADGKRIFVTDGEDVTWKMLTDELMPLADREGPLAELSREQAERIARGAPAPKLSVFRALKHLVGSDVRAALRKDPLLQKVDVSMRGLVAKLPGSLEDRVRLGVEGPTKVSKAGGASDLTSHLNGQQLRGVKHSCARAREVLGYEPLHTFAESMRIYRAWYGRMLGHGTPEWDLVKELKAPCVA